MSFLGKCYQLESNENLEAYTKALGVNTEGKKIESVAKSSITLSENAGIYTLTLVTAAKTQNVIFKLGEEVENVEVDGRKMKSTFTLDGNVLTQVLKGENKTSTIIRTFTDKQLTAELEVGGVKCTRIFKAVQ